MRNAPSRRSGETHSNAFATTLRARRTRPSGPPPQPSRSASSKPPPNNLPALRLDPGFCGRFGQTAPLRAPGWAARVAATTPWEPPAPRRALCTRKCSSNRRSRLQSAPLDCKVHLSTRKGPVGRAAHKRTGRIPHSGGRIPDAAPRARRADRRLTRWPSRRRNPTRSRHAARRSDGLSPPMPDRAGFITLTG